MLNDKNQKLLKEVAIATSLLLILEHTGLRKKILKALPTESRAELLALLAIFAQRYMNE